MLLRALITERAKTRSPKIINTSNSSIINNSNINSRKRSINRRASRLPPRIPLPLRPPFPLQHHLPAPHHPPPQTCSIINSVSPQRQRHSACSKRCSSGCLRLQLPRRASARRPRSHRRRLPPTIEIATPAVRPLKTAVRWRPQLQRRTTRRRFSCRPNTAAPETAEAVAPAAPWMSRRDDPCISIISVTLINTTTNNNSSSNLRRRTLEIPLQP